MLLVSVLSFHLAFASLALGRWNGESSLLSCLTLFFSEKDIIAFTLCMVCVPVNVWVHVPQHECEGQRTTCWSSISFMSILGIKLRNQPPWQVSLLAESHFWSCFPSSHPLLLPPLLLPSLFFPLGLYLFLWCQGLNQDLANVWKLISFWVNSIPFNVDTPKCWVCECFLTTTSHTFFSLSFFQRQWVFACTQSQLPCKSLWLIFFL